MVGGGVTVTSNHFRYDAGHNNPLQKKTFDTGFQARRSRTEGKRDKEEGFFFFFSIHLSLTSSVDRYWVTTGSTTTD